MMTRPRKNRTLRKAGFAYVEGWLPAERAEAIATEIEQHAAEVAALVKGEMDE